DERGGKRECHEGPVSENAAVCGQDPAKIERRFEMQVGFGKLNRADEHDESQNFAVSQNVARQSSRSVAMPPTSGDRPGTSPNTMLISAMTRASAGPANESRTMARAITTPAAPPAA